LSANFSLLDNQYPAFRPQNPPALFSYLAQQSPGKERVWDAACGNGQAALGLAPHFDHILTSDANPEQIEQAFPAENISYSIQAAEDTNFPNQHFDLVVVAQALHWFDLPTFWQELRRVLKPGGIFATFGYSWFRINPEIDQLFKTMILPALEPYWHEKNRLIWDHYANIDFPFKTHDAPDFEMAMQWNLDQFTGYLRSWSAVQAYSRKNEEDQFQQFQEALQEFWSEQDQTKKVTMDFFLIWGHPKELSS